MPSTSSADDLALPAFPGGAPDVARTATARAFFFLRVLGVKRRIAVNVLRTLKAHLIVHFVLFSVLVLMLLIGGSGAFYGLFHFLLAQEIVGSYLVDLLVNLVLLTFMVMLIFSNLIITLSTTYISREIDYYMSQPISYRDVFLFKLIETIVYSSWAFVILSLPLFIGYGVAKDQGPAFYVAIALLMVPFLLIPSALGAIVTMLLAASIPAKRSRMFMGVIGACALLGSVIAARMLGLNKLIRSSSWDDFNQFRQLLEAGNLQLLPNTWLAEATIAASRADWPTVLYWFLVLLSTALFLLRVCIWLVGPFYYRGWTMSRGASGSGVIDPKRSLFNKLDCVYSVFGRQLKALIGKDLRTFWRDPAQWSQLVILFGLLYIYIANIRSAAADQDVHIFVFHWQTLLSFLNMGATCFIVSIISTRFVYPMLSLEGRQFWVIGLAPLRRSKLIFQKYFFALSATLVLTVPLMIFSNIMLKVPDLIFWRSIVTLVTLSAGLISLSVGLGAMSPNFREDNPARIANGLGGTMNIVISLLYVGVIITVVSVPTYIELQGRTELVATVERWRPLLLAVFWATHVAGIGLPLALGIRAWKRLEF